MVSTPVLDLGAIEAKAREAHEADVLGREVLNDILALAAEVRRGREAERLWRALLRTREAYHEHSMSKEWSAYERAAADLREAGFDPEAP